MVVDVWGEGMFRRRDGDGDLSIMDIVITTRLCIKLELGTWTFITLTGWIGKKHVWGGYILYGSWHISKCQIDRIVAMMVVSVKLTALKQTKQRSDFKFNHWRVYTAELGNVFTTELATENEPIERVISMCNLWLEKTEENDLNKAQRKTWKNSLPGRLNEVRNRERRGLPVYRWIVEIMKSLMTLKVRLIVMRRSSEFAKLSQTLRWKRPTSIVAERPMYLRDIHDNCETSGLYVRGGWTWLHSRRLLKRGRTRESDEQIVD